MTGFRTTRFYYTSHHFARDTILYLAPFTTAMILLFLFYSNDVIGWRLTQIIERAQTSFLAGTIFFISILSASVIVGELIDLTTLWIHKRWEHCEILQNRILTYEEYIFGESYDFIESLYHECLGTGSVLPFNIGEKRGDTISFMVGSLFNYVRNHDADGYISLYRLWTKTMLARIIQGYSVLFLLISVLFLWYSWWYLVHCTVSLFVLTLAIISFNESTRKNAKIELRYITSGAKLAKDRREHGERGLGPQGSQNGKSN